MDVPSNTLQATIAQGRGGTRQPQHKGSHTRARQRPVREDKVAVACVSMASSTWAVANRNARGKKHPARVDGRRGGVGQDEPSGRRRWRARLAGAEWERSAVVVVVAGGRGGGGARHGGRGRRWNTPRPPAAARMAARSLLAAKRERF